MSKKVVFMCAHGAGKSRLAAAWFNAGAPEGWSATSAGINPQAAVSEHAPRLLAGTAVLPLLDQSAPRALSKIARADLIVAIDCQPHEVEEALHWRLLNNDFDEAMRDELRLRAEALADRLQHGDSDLDTIFDDRSAE